MIDSRFKTVTVREEMLAALKDHIKELEKIVQRARDLQEQDTWHWLGDGSDDLDSMSEGMIVKIRASDLRQMLIKVSWNA